ncbi:HAD family hydrolase [Acidobacteriota bacterium]
MIKVIFFDFDGVILESVDIKTDAFVELFREYPTQINNIKTHHLNNTGISRFEKIKIYFRDFIKQPLSEDKYQAFLNRFSEIVFDKVLAAPYVPGAKEFITAQSQNYDLYVISATPSEEIKRIVEDRNLSSHFKDVLGSPVNKGEWVKNIMRNMGYIAEEAVFIGDALSDYNAADENGIHFIGRLSDPILNPFVGLKVKHVLKDLTQLKEVLEDLGKP